MKAILKLIAYLGLAVTLVPSILFLFDTIELEAVKTYMLIGTVMWLATAPFIMKKDESEA